MSGKSAKGDSPTGGRNGGGVAQLVNENQEIAEDKPSEGKEIENDSDRSSEKEGTPTLGIHRHTCPARGSTR